MLQFQNTLTIVLDCVHCTRCSLQRCQDLSSSVSYFLLAGCIFISDQVSDHSEFTCCRVLYQCLRKSCFSCIL